MISRPAVIGVIGAIVVVAAVVLNYFMTEGPPSEKVAATPTSLTSLPRSSASDPASTTGSTSNSSGGAAVSGEKSVAPEKPEAPPKVQAAPMFDVVRVDPEGNAVIAGRARANTKVRILDGDKVIGEVMSDGRGDWVFVPETRLKPGNRVLTLSSDNPGEGKSESTDAVVLVIPEPGKDIAGAEATGDRTPLAMVVPRDQAVTAASRVLQAPRIAANKAPEVKAAEVKAVEGKVAGDAAPVGTTSGVKVPDAKVAGGAAAAVGTATGVKVPDTSAAGAAVAVGTASGVKIPDTNVAGGAAPVGTTSEVKVPDTSAAGGAAPVGTNSGVKVPDVKVAGAAVAVGTASGVKVPDTNAAGGAAPVGTTSGVKVADTNAAGTAAPKGTDSGAKGPDVKVAGASAREGKASEVKVAAVETKRATVRSFPEPEKSGAGGQSASDAGGDDVKPPVALDTVDYDDKGEVVFSGKSNPGDKVQVYVDNKLVGTTDADAEGRWTLRPTKTVEPGTHDVRVDKVAETGKVLARIVLPFVRAKPFTSLPNQTVVIIQPGNNLWRIASRLYGDGLRYTDIFQANADQIRDPDLIYPGQVFGLPRTN